MDSPFPYQGPLRPEQVQGRDDLIRDLLDRVTERRVIALLGPRRYGKTSVLRRLVSGLADVATVWVDLYEVTSMADVAVRFDEGLAAARGRFADAARRVGVELSLPLGRLGVAFTGRAADRPEPALAFHSLLDVLVRVSQRVPTLLVIDECSSIAQVEGAAGVLGTATQHHFQEIGLVFAGSHPSMMRSLFADRHQPFYGQADLVEVDRLDDATIEHIITAGFESTGRRAGRLGGLIGRFAAGHPQRTMQLADACWRLTPPGGDGGDEWADGLARVQDGVSEGMERLYSRFNASERAVLRAVARTGRIYGTGAELLELSKGAASHARQSLLDTGELARRAGVLVVVDPLMADWLRRRFAL